MNPTSCLTRELARVPRGCQGPHWLGPLELAPASLHWFPTEAVHTSLGFH